MSNITSQYLSTTIDTPSLSSTSPSFVPTYSTSSETITLDGASVTVTMYSQTYTFQESGSSSNLFANTTYNSAWDVDVVGDSATATAEWDDDYLNATVTFGQGEYYVSPNSYSQATYKVPPVKVAESEVRVIKLAHDDVANFCTAVMQLGSTGPSVYIINPSVESTDGDNEVVDSASRVALSVDWTPCTMLFSSVSFTAYDEDDTVVDKEEAIKLLWRLAQVYMTYGYTSTYSILVQPLVDLLSQISKEFMWYYYKKRTWIYVDPPSCDVYDSEEDMAAAWSNSVTLGDPITDTSAARVTSTTDSDGETTYSVAETDSDDYDGERWTLYASDSSAYVCTPPGLNLSACGYSENAEPVFEEVTYNEEELESQTCSSLDTMATWGTALTSLDGTKIKKTYDDSWALYQLKTVDSAADVTASGVASPTSLADVAPGLFFCIWAKAANRINEYSSEVIVRQCFITNQTEAGYRLFSTYLAVPSGTAASNLVLGNLPRTYIANVNACVFSVLTMYNRESEHAYEQATVTDELGNGPHETDQEFTLSSYVVWGGIGLLALGILLAFVGNDDDDDDEESKKKKANNSKQDANRSNVTSNVYLTSSDGRGTVTNTVRQGAEPAVGSDEWFKQLLS